MVPGSFGCGSAVLAAMAMLAPSRAARSAMARPMPRLAPVMNSVLPFKLATSTPRPLQFGEIGLPLFQEGRERLLRLRRGEALAENAGLFLDTLSQGARVATQQPAGKGKRLWWLRSQSRGSLARGRLQLIRADDRVDEARLPRPFGGERLTEHQKLERPRVAHALRSEQARPCFGHCPQVHERRHESRFPRRVDQIAMEQQRRADADPQSIYGCNHWLLDAHECPEKIEHRAFQRCTGSRPLDEIIDVVASSKYAA